MESTHHTTALHLYSIILYYIYYNTQTQTQTQTQTDTDTHTDTHTHKGQGGREKEEEGEQEREEDECQVNVRTRTNVLTRNHLGFKASYTSSRRPYTLVAQDYVPTRNLSILLVGDFFEMRGLTEQLRRY
jgi:hypothetical protein